MINTISTSCKIQSKISKEFPNFNITNFLIIGGAVGTCLSLLSKDKKYATIFLGVSISALLFKRGMCDSYIKTLDFVKPTIKIMNQ
jgi:hypothetical protein